MSALPVPVQFERFFSSVEDVPRFDIGTDPVVLNEIEGVPNAPDEVVELVATVDFRIAGPLRLFEFLRDGVVIATYPEFARQGTDSVLTMTTELVPFPPATVSTFALRTRGGSEFDDVFRSTLSVKVLKPVVP